MIVMIDNYDSFTYNIVQYLSELGADLMVFRNDEISAEELKGMGPNALVLSPGPGRPEGAGILMDLVKVMAGHCPILGVCLGHQAIAQVYGARIGYAPTLMHGKTSEIHHDDSVLYKEIPNPFVATRYHSLTIERSTLPKEFAVTAWTDDDVIMGIQHRTMPLYGLQYHPESILTEFGKPILSRFLESF